MPPRAPWVACAGAVVAAAVAILITGSKPLVGTVLIAGIVCLAGALLSGNVRLYLLWCTVLTAPTEFSKFFWIQRHMGGEYALRIELSDVFLGALCALWLADRRWWRTHRLRLPRPAVWWLGMAALGTGTVAFGMYRSSAAVEVLRMLKVLVLLLYVINQADGRRHLVHVVAALVTGMVLQSVIGWMQYFGHVELGLDLLGESQLYSENLGGQTVSRVGALMTHPNIFSGFLCMVLPLTVALLFTGIARIWKLLSVAALVLGSGALVFTLSRNGWISFAGAFTLVLALTYLHPRMRRRHALPRLVLLACVALAGLLATSRIVDRFTLTDPSSSHARWLLMDIAWRMIESRPLLGFGLNSWTYHMSDFTIRDFGRAFDWGAGGDLRLIPPVHNIYLQKWAEQGTAGLVLFLLWAGSLLRTGWRNLRVDDELLAALNIGALAGMCAILVHGLADWVFWLTTNMRVFWILASIVLAVHYLRGRQTEAEAVV